MALTFVSKAVQELAPKSALNLVKVFIPYSMVETDNSLQSSVCLEELEPSPETATVGVPTLETVARVVSMQESTAETAITQESTAVVLSGLHMATTHKST